MSDKEEKPKNEENENENEGEGEEDEQEYEVEAILKHRQRGRKKEYLIKWVGYPDSENTWEPEEHLTDVQEMLKSYWEDYNARKQKEKEEKKEKQKEKKEVKKEAKTVKKEKTPAIEYPVIEEIQTPKDPIDIIGATRISDGSIIFAVKQNGKNLLIPNKELRGKYARELLDFYEKHLEFEDTDSILFTL